MKSTSAVIMIAIIISVCAVGFAQDNGSAMEVIRISDHVIKIKADYVEYIAINTEKGIVVLNSLWCKEKATECRRLIEKTFNRSDFAYVIYLWERVDYVGGTDAFPEAKVIGQDFFNDKKFRNEQTIDAALENWKQFWQWKISIANQRLEDLQADSPQHNMWTKELATCQGILKDLSESYHLVYPSITFKDKLTLYLGDVTIKLYYFGKANRFNGNIMAVVPEDHVLFTGFMVHPHELAPFNTSFPDEEDIPKWLNAYDSIFKENKLDIAVLGNDLEEPGFWNIDRIHSRYDYIRLLWEEVNKALKEGETLEEIQDKLSLDKKFAFVKEWPLVKNNRAMASDIVRSHQSNIYHVFLDAQKVAAKEVFNTFENSGLDAAMLKFKELQKNPKGYYFDSSTFVSVGYKLLGENRIPEAMAFVKIGAEYGLDEASYNRIGYAFLSNHHNDEAIEVFKLGIDAFPNSANLYDSLGEAYMNNGDKELAIQNYQKSLELNPGNDNAKQMLKTLNEQ